MKHLLKTLVLFLCMLPAWSVAQTAVILEVKGDINPSSAWYVTRGIQYAEKNQAKLILLLLDTYGGDVISADSIRKALLRTPITTAVLIDENAASAGALISIACDSIYMADAATIGAATVVDENGKPAPPKYQAFWKGVFRATAEQNGRDPRIAEKMVDPSLHLDSISPAGQVIHFTAREAITFGYCEGEASDYSDVALSKFQGINRMEFFKLSTGDSLINFLVKPGVSIVLLILIFAGMFLELKAPGKGFPGIISIFATALYFAPHYAFGLADYWEMGVFLIGLALIALEIFVTPGFGVPGIAGLIFTVTALVGGTLQNDGLDFGLIPLKEILKSLAFTLASMATSIVLALWLAQYIATSKRGHPLVDSNTLDREQGYTAIRSDITALVGLEGIAATDLRPSGFIEIDGKRYQAESAGSYILKGAALRVKMIKNTILIVELT